jgi:hypothetical protein
VTVAGAAAAIVLVGQGAFGVKAYQTEVIGAIGTANVYDKTVPAPIGSDAVNSAEAAAAATIQIYGACPSQPRVVSHKKFNTVVQLTGSTCSGGGGGLSCNSTGGNGSSESTPTRACETTSTTRGE